MEGSRAGGMHSNFVFFLPMTSISSAMSEAEHLLMGVLPTQASFSCELPVYIIQPFIYSVISTTDIFSKFVVFLLA